MRYKKNIQYTRDTDKGSQNKPAPKTGIEERLLIQADRNTCIPDIALNIPNNTNVRKYIKNIILFLHFTLLFPKQRAFITIKLQLATKI